MTAKDLLSNEIFPLKTSITGAEVIEQMCEYHVSHLPIVNNEQLLGVIAEDEILDNDDSQAIGTYALTLRRPFVHENDHLYSVMNKIAEQQLSLVPVINDNGDYIGVVTQSAIMQFFSRSSSFTLPGSLLILEMTKQDYSLATISQIVETERAAILSNFIFSSEESELARVVIKINKKDVRHIAATFERYGMRVAAMFNEADYADEFLSDRYDSLMSYLSV